MWFKKSYCAILLGILASSCSVNDLQSKLSFQCSSSKSLENLKKLTDVKNTFSIKIPKNWKRELYVSSKESRIYFADTTKELEDAYIFDIGYLKESQAIDNNFIANFQKELTKNNQILEQSGKFFHAEKKGYFFLSSSENFGMSSKNLHVYIQGNTFCYRVNIDVYGDQNIESRFCEALQFFNGISFHK
jgi:hypothetical protein